MPGQQAYNHELAINQCFIGEGSALKSLDLKVCGDDVDVGSESEFAVVIRNGNNEECTMTIKGKIAFIQIIISEINRVWGVKWHEEHLYIFGFPIGKKISETIFLVDFR